MPNLTGDGAPGCGGPVAALCSPAPSSCGGGDVWRCLHRQAQQCPRAIFICLPASRGLCKQLCNVKLAPAPSGSGSALGSPRTPCVLGSWHGLEPQCSLPAAAGPRHPTAHGLRDCQGKVYLGLDAKNQCLTQPGLCHALFQVC